MRPVLWIQCLCAATLMGCPMESKITDTLSDGVGDADTDTDADADADTDTDADVPTAPVAVDDAETVDEGDVVIIELLLNDTDVNGDMDVSTVVIIDEPASGVAMVNATGRAQYSHDSSETAYDAFTYTVDDAAGQTSNIATVNLAINPINDPPVAVDDADALAHAGYVNIDVAANDQDDDDGLDVTSVTIIAPPLRGTAIAQADGTVDYSHDGSPFGSDSFTYQISDLSGATSNTATVALTVTGGPGGFCQQGNGGCLLVGSTSGDTVYVYDPVTLTVAATIPGTTGVQSVAGGPGLIYAGGTAEVFEVDPVTLGVTSMGAGLVSGNLYGISVSAQGQIFTSGSGMSDIQILNADGTDGGIVDVLTGTNLRSTTFNPAGDLYLTAFSTDAVEWWTAGYNNQGTFTGGGLGTPFGIAVKANGDVVVASQNNAAYYTFTSSGAFLSSTAVACNGQIRNLAIDGGDYLYVGCYDDDRVAIFSPANVEVNSIAVASPAGVGMLWEWP